MEIVLNRIDERLIHGQLLASWTKKLRAEKIIIIDDALCEDSFVKSVMLMTLPRGIGMEVLSVEQAARLLIHSEPRAFDSKAIVLFKEPATAYAMVQKGYHMDALNIGCMAAQPKRGKISNYVYASDREVQMFKEMVEMGIDVYIQIVYAEARISISDVLHQ